LLADAGLAGVRFYLVDSKDIDILKCIAMLFSVKESVYLFFL
jgi:hypothetical protein